MVARRRTTSGPLGVYPGSFDPLTIAHLHIARLAVARFGLRRLDLSISTRTLGKDDDALSSIAARLETIETVIGDDATLGVRITGHSLLAEVADGYDLLVVGADKWHQILEPQWYESPEERLRLLTALPPVAIAPRPPFAPASLTGAEVPSAVKIHLLETDPEVRPISASAVRAGREEWRARRPDRR